MRKKTNRKIYKFRKSVSTKSIRFKKIFSLLVKLHRFYCLITSPLHVLPDFYIIGTQKGGTSSLYDYLTTHPSIEPCYTKEPSYFDRYFERGLHWYKVNFPFKIHKFIATNILKNKFITGEASVRYLDHPFAPQRIKEITPNAKFIILLRNPIDRAHSHYTMIYRRNSESSSFVDAIENEKERITEPFNKMLNDSNYYSDIYFRHAYLHRGIYVDKIKRWMEVFPKEQFLIIQSEEFFKNPSKIYNDVLEFLGLIPFSIGEFKIKGKVNKNRNIDDDFRNELVEYFKPHNKRLYDFLGKSFDWEK